MARRPWGDCLGEDEPGQFVNYLEIIVYECIGPVLIRLRTAFKVPDLWHLAEESKYPRSQKSNGWRVFAVQGVGRFGGMVSGDEGEGEGEMNVTVKWHYMETGRERQKGSFGEDEFRFEFLKPVDHDNGLGRLLDDFAGGSPEQEAAVGGHVDRSKVVTAGQLE